MTEARQGEETDFGFERIAASEKAARVRSVFDRVANRYDLMNDLMSAGIHRAWKDVFVTLLAPRPGMSIVDIAGGTGDIAFRTLERSRRGTAMANVAIIDINAEMLKAGRARAEAQSLKDCVTWTCGDAERLPLADGMADAYTIAFGIRNVTHRDRALLEARRVLKPGGRFLCLEFSAPVVPILDAAYERFSQDVIPRIGAFVTGDAGSYCYLIESIRRFPPQDQFTNEIRAAGFKRAMHRNLSGGIVAIHSAWAY